MSTSRKEQRVQRTVWRPPWPEQMVWAAQLNLTDWCKAGGDLSLPTPHCREGQRLERERLEWRHTFFPLVSWPSPYTSPAFVPCYCFYPQLGTFCWVFFTRKAPNKTWNSREHVMRAQLHWTGSQWDLYSRGNSRLLRHLLYFGTGASLDLLPRNSLFPRD